MVSDNAPAKGRPLAIAFMILGASLCVAFGVSLGPAFMGLGAPFFVLGLIFMTNKKSKDAGGDES